MCTRAAATASRAFQGPAGGYAGDTVVITITAQSAHENDIVVYDIRLVDILQEPVADGPAIFLDLLQGETKNLMDFNLGEQPPVAMAQDAEGHSTDIPFFRTSTINVRRGDSETSSIKVTAGPGATFSFKIAFDYVFDGKKHTQAVDNFGEPFRVTARTCRYSAVAEPSDVDAFGRPHSMQQVDPGSSLRGQCG